MASKIGAAVFGILALALLGTAATSPALALSGPRLPSVPWLDRSAPVRDAVEEPAALAPAHANPAAVAEPELPDDPDAEAQPLQPQKPVAAPAKPAPVVAVATPEPAAEPAKPAVVEPAKPAVVEPARPVEPPKPALAQPEAVQPATPRPAVAKPAPQKPSAKPAAVKPPPAPTPAAGPAEATASNEPAELAPAAAAKPAATRPAAPAAPAVQPEPEEEGTGTLSVASTPAGAAVFLDDAIVGQTPIEIDVPAGSHKLRVMHPATSREKRQTVRVKSGATAQVSVTF